jgi:hypothetical protein
MRATGISALGNITYQPTIAPTARPAIIPPMVIKNRIISDSTSAVAVAPRRRIVTEAAEDADRPGRARKPQGGSDREYRQGFPAEKRDARAQRVRCGHSEHEE